MAILTTDILFNLSTKSGSAGYSLTSTPAGSLGKFISTTAFVAATLDNLFDVVTGDENAASDVEYRLLFVRNAHATLTLVGAVAFLSAEVAGGAVAAIGIDTTAASVLASGSAQAVEIATEQNAPSGISFSAPTTKGAGLSLGDIPPGYCRGVWIRRTAAASGALNNDGVTVRVEGDTAE